MKVWPLFLQNGLRCLSHLVVLYVFYCWQRCRTRSNFLASKTRASFQQCPSWVLLASCHMFHNKEVWMWFVQLERFSDCIDDNMWKSIDQTGTWTSWDVGFYLIFDSLAESVHSAGGLQQEWKEKMKHPSFRKAGFVINKSPHWKGPFHHYNNRRTMARDLERKSYTKIIYIFYIIWHYFISTIL